MACLGSETVDDLRAPALVAIGAGLALIVYAVAVRRGWRPWVRRAATAGVRFSPPSRLVRYLISMGGGSMLLAVPALIVGPSCLTMGMLILSFAPIIDATSSGAALMTRIALSRRSNR